MELFQPWHIIFLLLLPVLVVIPFWQIFKKAGFNPALSLLLIVPAFNLFVIYFVAFAPWRPNRA